jgi:hypothetical protein
MDARTVWYWFVIFLSSIFLVRTVYEVFRDNGYFVYSGGGRNDTP